jgi:hypothetical protein
MMHPLAVRAGALQQARLHLAAHRPAKVQSREFERTVASSYESDTAIPSGNGGAVAMAYILSSGMTRAHFDVFQRVAHKADENRIIVVRNTNTKSTHWIQMGYPPKPKSLEPLHTSAKTGKVTATNEEERKMARDEGFFVIDNDGIARLEPGVALPKRFPFNTTEMNEPGQVIHPKQMKALVGDYDLMGIIDPDAKGRVLVLHSVNGVTVKNRSNPDVDAVMNKLNSQMDQPRVMHGPQDLYKGFKGACTAFLTEGEPVELKTEGKVKEFYSQIGRQTITGTYR